MGPQQPMKHNRNAEHQQRRRAHRQQMEEAKKAICLVDTERGAQAHVSSE